MTQTAPGWYSDPHVAGQQRYWDGLRWTDHRAPGALPAVRTAAYPVIVSDQSTNSAMVAISWIITIVTVGYMLPWAIAETRGKSNSLAVGLVNLLVGWTLIGWIVALVMACTAHGVRGVYHA